MEENIKIRNSTIDFLVFTKDAGEEGIEVRVQNHDVWLTQKAIAMLFDVDRSVVTKHLKNIFNEGELEENSVCAKFAQTADDGKNYQYKFYSFEEKMTRLTTELGGLFAESHKLEDEIRKKLAAIGYTMQ